MTDICPTCKRPTKSLVEDRPSLDDVMRAGLGISEALAFWHNMMSYPDAPPKTWWDMLAVYRKSKTQ